MSKNIQYSFVEYTGDYQIDNQRCWGDVFPSMESAEKVASEIFYEKMGKKPNVNSGKAPVRWARSNKYYIEINEVDGEGNETPKRTLY
jgi:hypothetical protein